jgi:hypothetical protein
MYSLYLITGQNGKIYVGQTKLNPPRKRWLWHIYASKQTARNYHFVNAIRRYGSKFFTFQVIGGVKTKEEANRAETLYILLFNSYKKEFGYNSTFGGEGVIHTEKTKQKLRNPSYRLDVTDDDIRKQYLECGNYLEVGRRLFLSYTAVRNRCIALNLKESPKEKLNKSGETRYNYISSVTPEQVYREYQKCKNISEVSRRVGLSWDAINQRYKKYLEMEST